MPARGQRVHPVVRREQGATGPHGRHAVLRRVHLHDIRSSVLLLHGGRGQDGAVGARASSALVGLRGRERQLYEHALLRRLLLRGERARGWQAMPSHVQDQRGLPGHTGCCTDPNDVGVNICSPKAACDTPCKKRGGYGLHAKHALVIEQLLATATVSRPTRQLAGCRPLCNTSADCDTGCCQPFSNGGGFCVDASYCSCPPIGAACGPDLPQCCTGTGLRWRRRRRLRVPTNLQFQSRLCEPMLLDPHRLGHQRLQANPAVFSMRSSVTVTLPNHALG